jgi:hypothetical protein
MEQLKQIFSSRTFSSVLKLGVLLLGVIIVGAMFLGGESYTTAANRFMSSLAKGDVDELTKVSYIPDLSSEEIHKKWEESVRESEHYRFAWKSVADAQDSETKASVKLLVVRNAFGKSGYDENFGLSLVKVKGKWLVDVRSISRKMYPWLPR